MCGIAGLAGISDKSLLRKMCDSIEHRGPNHYGNFVDKNISLGYRRLSIIDVKGGNQPIFNEAGDAIVFNGEIYNYKQLKAELEKKGHKFRTNSDTETIVHGYEEWGVGVASKLRGMFAFAIWDARKRQLLLARDKFGKKPLYYSEIDGKLAFASEMKSLRMVPGFDASLDYAAIDEYLAYRFIPSPHTIFKNTKKLPPAHYLVWKDGKIKIERYWSLSYSPESHSEGYFAKKVRNLLDESVRIRLMSEVPLGAYLSGGLDSSSVVAIMAKHMQEPVKTFSVGFGVEKYDELPFAKQVAEEFSTDHHEITVSPSSIKELPKILWHLDEPMADPTSIPTYFLSRFAKRKVTVVLTGEGGDEVFAGYEQYKIMQLAYNYGRKVPRVVRKHVLANAARATPKFILDKLFKYSSALGRKGIDRFSGFISDLDSPARSYLDLVQICTKNEREGLYGNEPNGGRNGNIGGMMHQFAAKDHSIQAGKIIHSHSSEKLLSEMQLFDIATELPEDLLMKVDKMTMAFSVEARAPLLDVPLAELAFTIPSSMKMRGSREKYILRKAMAPLLPKSITGRKKARFFVPIDYWFGGDLKSISENLLLGREQVLFSGDYVRKILADYPSSKAYCARQLWNLISLQLWLKQSELGKPVELDRLLE